MTGVPNGVPDVEAHPSPSPHAQELHQPIESGLDQQGPIHQDSYTSSFSPSNISLDSALVSVDYTSPTPSISDRTLGTRLRTALHLENGSSRERPPLSYNHRLEPKIRSLDEFPQGYGKVAAFQECDPNFLVYRKFSWLHGRVLLHHQDELAELEDKLEHMDKHENDSKKLVSRRRDDAVSDSRRKALLMDIEKKLAVYDELLLRFQQVQAVKQPTPRNQNSLFNFIHNTGSLVTSEAEWVQRRDDLAAIAQDKEDGWFKGFLEDMLNRISRHATTFVFRSKDQRIRTGKEEVNLLSHKRFDAFIYTLITILATVLLLVPVSVLWVVQDNGLHQILVIFFFTLTFSACCSVFTKARRQEVFTATAAYCAVLVIFLGNTSNKEIANKSQIE